MSNVQKKTMTINVIVYSSAGVVRDGKARK